MGKPKHGKDSARAKSNKLNKAKKAETIESGKKCKTHKKPKTRLQKLTLAVEKAERERKNPLVIGVTTHWGKTDDKKKSDTNTANKKNDNKSKSSTRK